MAGEGGDRVGRAVAGEGRAVSGEAEKAGSPERCTPPDPQATITTDFLPGPLDDGKCDGTQRCPPPPFFFFKATLISSLQIKFPC